MFFYIFFLSRQNIQYIYMYIQTTVDGARGRVRVRFVLFSFVFRLRPPSVCVHDIRRVTTVTAWVHRENRSRYNSLWFCTLNQWPRTSLRSLRGVSCPSRTCRSRTCPPAAVPSSRFPWKTLAHSLKVIVVVERRGDWVRRTALPFAVPLEVQTYFQLTVEGA